MIIERIYHEGIREPLRWIALAVFQPARFRVACEPTGFRQRAGMQARLIVPLFLLSLLLVTLVRIIPLPAHLLVWSNWSSGCQASMPCSARMRSERGWYRRLVWPQVLR